MSGYLELIGIVNELVPLIPLAELYYKLESVTVYSGGVLRFWVTTPLVRNNLHKLCSSIQILSSYNMFLENLEEAWVACLAKFPFEGCRNPSLCLGPSRLGWAFREGRMISSWRVEAIPIGLCWRVCWRWVAIKVMFVAVMGGGSASYIWPDAAGWYNRLRDANGFPIGTGSSSLR